MALPPRALDKLQRAMTCSAEYCWQQWVLKLLHSSSDLRSPFKLFTSPVCNTAALLNERT
jgi:hypothetical protein